MQRYQGQHSGLTNGSGNLPVMLEGSKLEPTRLRFDSRPGNGEPENFASKIASELDILWVAIPKSVALSRWV